jgi:hypothetical protein
MQEGLSFHCLQISCFGETQWHCGWRHHLPHFSCTRFWRDCLLCSDILRAGMRQSSGMPCTANQGFTTGVCLRLHLLMANAGQRLWYTSDEPHKGMHDVRDQVVAGTSEYGRNPCLMQPCRSLPSPGMGSLIFSPMLTTMQWVTS